jgi:ketosteroid isomerase-like protein
VLDRANEAYFSTKDYDALREVYAPDVVATTPDAGTLHGIDALIEWNRALDEAFPDMHYLLSAAHEAGECAIDQGDVVGTHTGPMTLPNGETVEPSGKEVRVRCVDIATVRDGKIVRHDFYFDQLELMAQLGLMEAPTTTP